MDRRMQSDAYWREESKLFRGDGNKRSAEDKDLMLYQIWLYTEFQFVLE